jgi:hypothetical protein
MVEKILPAREGVQLIVFLCAIREILKKEIYAPDKEYFCALKTKARLSACAAITEGILNLSNSVCG